MMSDQRSSESTSSTERRTIDDIDIGKQIKHIRLDITDTHTMIQTYTNTHVNTNSAHANSPAGTNEQISHIHSVLEGIVVSEADTVDPAMITRKIVQAAQRGGPARIVRQRQAKGALAKHVQWRTEHMRELNERLRHVFDKPALTESEQAQVQADMEMEKEVASRDVAEQIARMEERYILAREKKASLIREQHGVTARKVQLERQRGEALKNAVNLVDKCARVQDDNESMQRELWEMETDQLQTKIDNLEDMQYIQLSSDEHKEKVYRFVLQEYVQLQGSAYEPKLEAARNTSAQKLDHLTALLDKVEELDRIAGEVNAQWDHVNETKRDMPTNIERLMRLIVKRDTVKDMYGKLMCVRNRASDNLRAACATVFENNMEIRRHLRKTHYATRMLRLQLPSRERKPLLKLKWTRTHTLNLASYIDYVAGKKRVMEAQYEKKL